MKRLNLTLIALVFSLQSFAQLPVIITGDSVVCVGSSITLTEFGPVLFLGTWSSSNITLATVSPSVGASTNVTGVSVGIVTITFSTTSGYVTKMVTVDAAPTPITGPTASCAGAVTVMSDATSGGTWGISPVTVATISATGNVTAVSPGTATVTYTLFAGCSTSLTITVDPSSSPITGPTNLCSGATTTLTDAVTGGTWSSTNPSVATIGSGSGLVTGITTGTTTISYIPPSACFTATMTMTIVTVPGPITGTTHVCAGGTTILSDVGSGTWSSSPTIIATIGSITGIVTGVTAGIATITYSLGAGCTTLTTVTVNGLPAPIGGTASLCVGATATLTDATGGGTWTSSNPAIATIGSTTGIVNGVAAGTSLITYVTGGGCMATTTATVNPLPAAITGTRVVCVGSMTTLSDASSGGIWSSGSLTTATVGSVTGVVTGVSAGTDTVTYRLTTTGCHTSTVVTVDPLPCTTGIQESLLANGAQVHIYPNPTTEELTITIDKDAYSSFFITSQIGQILIMQPLTATQTKVNVTMLANGFYYIILKGSNGGIVRKFVKM
jgi:trimeric autotransporter adhesin